MNATALIAEDEPLLARALQSELAKLWPELEILAVAPNGIQAQRDLLALCPDVAFLDVRMPGASGIEVAQAIAEDWPEERQPPLLVFVTAYEQFAVEAFSQAAVDYVLKPVQASRLLQTVQRLKQRLNERASGNEKFAAPSELRLLASRLQQLLEDPSGHADFDGGSGKDAQVGERSCQAVQKPERLRAIRAGSGETVRLIKLDEVIYLQATDKYVNVVTADAEALIREPLRDLLPQLNPQQFTRIHRSTLVNLDFVRSGSRDASGKFWLTLHGRKERLLVSRLYTHVFKAM